MAYLLMFSFYSLSGELSVEQRVMLVLASHQQRAHGGLTLAQRDRVISREYGSSLAHEARVLVMRLALRLDAARLAHLLHCGFQG